SPPTAADHHGGDLGRVTINNQDGPVSPAPDRGGALRGLCAAECAPAAPARRGHHVLIGTTAAVSVPVPRFRAVEFLSEDPVPLLPRPVYSAHASRCDSETSGSRKRRTFAGRVRADSA